MSSRSSRRGVGASLNPIRANGSGAGPTAPRGSSGCSPPKGEPCLPTGTGPEASRSSPAGRGLAERRAQSIAQPFNEPRVRSSAAKGWRHRSIWITHFDRYDNPRGRRVATTWADIFSLLAAPIEDCWDKYELPLWSPAMFRGDYRNGVNVIEVCALGFDDDVRALAWPDAITLWQSLEVAGLVHTTWNHSTEQPSRRVILALSRAVSAAEYDVIWVEVESWVAALEHRVGTARDSSRQWFRPALPPSGEFQFAELPGEPLDVDATLAAASSRIARARSVRARIQATSGAPRDSWFAEAARIDGLILREVDTNRLAIVCPYAHEHSDAPGPRDTSTVIFAPRGSNLGRIFCFHDHCRQRTSREWQAAFSDVAVEAADRAYPSLYLRARATQQLRKSLQRGGVR